MPLSLLAEDRARHDVARRELGERDARLTMKRSPLRVDEHRAFAAHRLGDQRERVLRRVERGRMELHELHVGQRHAGAMRDREAVAGGDDGIRRVAIDLAAAAGREHGRVGDDLGRAAGDARAHADALRRAATMRSSTRACSSTRMRSLARTRAMSVRATSAPVWSPCAWTMRFVECAASRPSLSSPARVEIELRAGRLQLAHARRPFLHEHLTAAASHSAAPAASVSCRCSVGRIAGAERGGDAALRVRGGAVEQRALGQQQHVAVLATRAMRCAGRRRRCRRRGIAFESIGHGA